MSEPDNPAHAVLLVEDEPLVRLFLAELLLEAGLRVIEAANAAEALTVLEAGIRVHVLLADVEMPPGRNGYELAREVHERWPAVEILMASGRQWPGDGDLPPGAVFLAKPCPNETIVSHVCAAASRAERAYDDVPKPDQSGEPQVVPFPKRA
jgi:CheY-like chemotaxis protein